MVRAPDVDQRIGIFGLLEVIGEVCAKIRPCTVRFLDRAILVVTEFGRAKQGKFDRLPIFRRCLSLWRFEHTVIDKTVFAQPGFCFFRLLRGLQLGLGREKIVVDTEQREVFADHVHHRGDGTLAEEFEPLVLGRILVSGPEFLRQLFTDRLQVVARIEPFGDSADVLTQRLAIAQVRRTREDIDLATGIVDVIFADDLVAGEFKQLRQCIADHGTAAVTHVHRACRIGRHIFHVYRLSGTDLRTAVSLTQPRNCFRFAQPGLVRQPQVDEARPCNTRFGNIGLALQMLDNQFGERARIGLRLLREDHGGIGGQIAVRRIAWRLYRDTRTVRFGWKVTFHLESIENGVDLGRETGVQGLDVGHARAPRRMA